MNMKPTNHSSASWPLFQPLLQALHELGRARIDEVVEKIAEIEQIPESELEKRYEKSGQPIFKNRVQFARQYLVWEKYLDDSTRGIWSLTPEGEKHINLSPEEAQSIAQKWQKFLRDQRSNGAEAQTTDASLAPEEEPVQEELQKVTLQQALRAVSPRGFELLCEELIRSYEEFSQIRVTPLSHDGGIDIEAVQEINPFLSFRVAIQCKRYKENNIVSTDAIHAFCNKTDKKYDRLIFITSSYFAKSISAHEINPKLVLIDGDKLAELMIERKLGIEKEPVYYADPSFFQKFK